MLSLEVSETRRLGLAGSVGLADGTVTWLFSTEGAGASMLLSLEVLLARRLGLAGWREKCVRKFR